MATTVGILRAIGIFTVPPVFLDSLIDRDDIGIEARIDTERRLVRSLITREVELKSKIKIPS